MKKVLPLRIGVGAIVLNDNNHVFVGKRKDNPIDKWQMPQGGVNEGEDYLKAMKRELHEETSIKNIHVLKEFNEWLEYDLPKNLFFTSIQRTIVEEPNCAAASLMRKGFLIACVFKIAFSAPHAITSLMSSIDFIPPPTEKGILASSPTLLITSEDILLPSKLASISSSTNSSALRSLKIFTAFIGSPI